ncbi:MAG: SGNH/GDSL hydrolase family protein [Candidatus Brocadiaceae bacterium]|jgi:lysophospholipase L1-like esterase
MAFALEPGQTVLFIGDSITDCGRRGEHHPLGAGYVRMAVDLMRVRYPEHGCRFINTGIGGNIVRDLYDRWTDDCIRFQPDWLSVMIGINDLHRWLSANPDSYDVKGYEDYYRRILDRAAEETDAELILITPFYMSTAAPGEEEGWRGRVMQVLPDYLRTVEQLADDYGARLVEPHAMFQEQLKHHRPDHFGDEPVHPNATGHLMIAHEWLGVLGW